MTALRDAKGHWLPGESPNPSGRPKLKVSLVKLLQDRLEGEPETADAIVDAWIAASKFRDMRAITEMLDRLEGKVPEKHQIQSAILHISDAYALEVLKAMSLVEEERQRRLELPERLPNPSQEAL